MTPRALFALFALACGHASTPAAPVVAPPSAAVDVSALLAPEPLPSGPCRILTSAELRSFYADLSAARVAFDARGGLVVMATGTAFAASVSPDGALGPWGNAQWSADVIEVVVRAGDRFMVVYRSQCAREAGSCAHVGVLDASGHTLGAPISFPLGPGSPSLRTAVDGGALYVLAPSASDAIALDRIVISPRDTLEREQVMALRSADGHAHRPLALAVSGDRWAALYWEASTNAVFLLTSETDEPVRQYLPLPRATAYAALTELDIAGEHIEIAGRAGADAPAWIVQRTMSGRAIGPALRLADDDTFRGNFVRAELVGYRRWARRDALARPIGEPLELSFGATELAAGGDGRAFFAIGQSEFHETFSFRLECDAGSAPAPAPRVPFEGDPSPARPCGPVACLGPAPTLPDLSRLVSAECDRLSFPHGRPADRDASADGLHLENRPTGDAAIAAAATFECVRGIEHSANARWLFLAAQSAAGWSACLLDGARADLFDVDVRAGPLRLESWIEGGAPELVVPVVLDDSATDGGEISDSRAERLHVCGLDEGRMVCFGALLASSYSRSGPADDDPEPHEHRYRIEPDGRGSVTITPERPPGPAIRRAVRQLGDGCPDTP